MRSEADRQLAMECLRLAAKDTVPGVGPLDDRRVVERAEAFYAFVNGVKQADEDKSKPIRL